LFSRLGVTAFGGPAAHIALMQTEVVSRRRWLSEERFLDLMGATNLIPGPNSTELALHIGWERRRGAGLLVAGFAFIVPAMLITGALGWAYVRFGSVPSAAWLLYGVKPVMIGVVLQAIWGLAPRAARSARLRLLAALVLMLSAAGAHELVLLFGAGGAAAAAHHLSRGDRAAGGAPALVPLLPLTAATVAASTLTLQGLFWAFFKIGSVLYGSGYVLLAFLRAELVQRQGWLTEAQLIDGIAVGQVTPGPVFTTATFIGYVLAGPAGAGLATLGIFLPAFLFVALSGPLVPRLRASPGAGAFLDGVNVASLALMVMVTLQLGRSAIVDLPSAALGLGSAALLLRFKPNPTWLVLAGAALGWAVHAVRGG
jgi:chromate transporter